MDNLEERNLNRLRNGKMMLAFAKEKKSFGITLLLTIAAGTFGAHRFYLGHNLIGFAYLTTMAVAILGFLFDATNMLNPIGSLIVIIPMLLTIAILVEIILSYWIVGRENERIKTRLSEDYGVLNYKVS